jgi:hypothetical protein
MTLDDIETVAKIRIIAIQTIKIKSFNKIKGLEPTMVIVPPKIAVNPIGINSRDIGIPERDEIRLTTGINSAAAPTFCIKDEINPTVEEIMGMTLGSEVPPITTIDANGIYSNFRGHNNHGRL